MNGTNFLGVALLVLAVITLALVVTRFQRQARQRPPVVSKDSKSGVPRDAMASIAGQTAMGTRAGPLADTGTPPADSDVSKSQDGGGGSPTSAASPQPSLSLTAWGSRVTVARGLLAENVLVAQFTDHRSPQPLLTTMRRFGGGISTILLSGR